MAKKNKYGLTRDIPEPIKRQVRQACGFGCVICGASIIDYEHVDPPFAEAQKHDPNQMTLLCPQHHAKVTRGFLSKDSLTAAMGDPFCKKSGYTSELLDIGKSDPVIVFGGVKTFACPIPIAVQGVPLFEVKEAEEDGSPFRLSANFSNARGNPSLAIVDNEWRAFGTNWDVEVTGGTIIIRDSPKHVSLKLVAQPPTGIVIDELDMYLNGYRFLGSPGELVFQDPTGRRIKATGWIAHSCPVGLSIG
jgi:hypothetical protein